MFFLVEVVRVISFCQILLVCNETDDMNQLDKMFASLNDEPNQDEKEESAVEEQDPSEEIVKFSAATPKAVEEIKENAKKNKKRGWFG